MAKAHSSRRRPPGRPEDVRPSDNRVSTADPAKSGRKRPVRSAARPGVKKKPTTKRADLDEILGHFSDALALAETAYSVLDEAQQDYAGICPAVRTLERGLGELRRVYTEFDMAILRRS